MLGKKAVAELRPLSRTAGLSKTKQNDFPPQKSRLLLTAVRDSTFGFSDTFKKLSYNLIGT